LRGALWSAAIAAIATIATSFLFAALSGLLERWQNAAAIAPSLIANVLTTQISEIGALGSQPLLRSLGFDLIGAIAPE
jgi:hypothetical protein